MKLVKEFQNFLAEFKIVGLALAVVIGTSSSALINSLVDNIVMPVTSPLTGGIDWSQFEINVLGINIKLGVFIGDLIKFMIMAFTVFMIMKMMK